MMRSLFLALAASALGLHAGLTLSTPGTTSAGETLMMKATGHGAETKERWSWAFWLDGRAFEGPAQPLHLDASTCTVCLVVPPDATNQVLKVEVRRGGEVASDTLLVVPATEDMGEAKHPPKKARTQPPEETKDPSAPAIDKLPRDLSRLLASFLPDPLRYVNKAMNEDARQAELWYAPCGDFSDDTLLRYVQRHKNLRELDLDLGQDGSTCSEAGVLKALQAMRKLERLKIASRSVPFEPEALTEVLRTLPRLTHLDLRDCLVTHAGFKSLHHLKELTVRQCPLTFEHTLPPGLEVLTVEDCESFTGKGLPTTLRVLKVEDCAAFEGVGLPALGELKVARCPLFSGRDLAPGLHTLVLEHANDFTGAGLPVTLEHLGVVSCPAFSGGCLPAGLKTLSVLHVEGFTGETLPPGLESLKVQDAFTFLGKSLPERLRALEVAWADHFNPGRLPETLTSLTVAHCSAFTGAGLPEGLRTLDVGMDNTGEFDPLFPGFGNLSLRCYDPAKVEPSAGVLATAEHLKGLGLNSFDASVLHRFPGPRPD